MAKKKTQRVSPAAANREAGWQQVATTPLLRQLAGGGPRADSSGDAMWARVEFGRYGAQILYNPDRLATPGQWAWVFAHALLHIGLNHSDPATSGALRRDMVHHAVSCVAVDRLLDALKVGTCPFPMPDLPAPDELALARAWRRDGIPPEFLGLGTAGPAPDIVGEVETVDSRAGQYHARALAVGLSDAVTKVVDRAAGVADDSAAKNAKKVWDVALGWFVSSFPLLGGLASGFRLVADAEICRANDIDVAAVDPTVAEIYVNPNAGLNQAEWRFVLAHEMLHAGLRHGQRAMGRDPYLWNVACDYVINGWLVEMHVGDLPEGLLFDLELSGLSAEAVYDRIANDVRRFRKLATLRGKALGDILGEPLPLPREALGGIDLDEFYRRALTTGLAYHDSSGRGLVPAGLVEEIRVIDQPPISWDVALARWFEAHVRSPEPVRSYSRPSRRQASTPGIPRPGRYFPTAATLECTFGVVLDTSGSMSGPLLGKALGAIAAYARAKDVPAARVVYCDAAPHDAGYLPVDDIAGVVTVTGRGGTVLQPAVRFLERAADFPADGPILIITDGQCDPLRVHRDHAYLIPAHAGLPFAPGGPVFRVV